MKPSRPDKILYSAATRNYIYFFRFFPIFYLIWVTLIQPIRLIPHMTILQGEYAAPFLTHPSWKNTPYLAWIQTNLKIGLYPPHNELHENKGISTVSLSENFQSNSPVRPKRGFIFTFAQSRR